MIDQLKEHHPMSTRPIKCMVRFIQAILLLTMPIILIESGAGCAEINVGETLAPTHSSFSVYALSRGRGVPGEARQVLQESRRLLNQAQKKGEVKRIVDRRIGLEGETRLCVEFSDEQAAKRLFGQIQHLSDGVDLVNLKKEPCPP